MKNIIKVQFLHQKDLIVDSIQFKATRNLGEKLEDRNEVVCSKAIISKRVDEFSGQIFSKLWQSQVADMIVDMFPYQEENNKNGTLAVEQWCRVILKNARIDDYNFMSDETGIFETFTVNFEGILLGTSGE